VTPQQVEIVKAIEQELDSASRKRHFKIVSAVVQKSTIGIRVRSQLNGSKLDYTREEGSFVGPMPVYSGSRFR
jgi:pantothenate synthetase